MPTGASDKARLVLALFVSACFAGLLRFGVAYIPALAAGIEDPTSGASDWIREFDVRRYTGLGAVWGSALLERELGALFPAGSDSTDLARTLMSAGFDCLGFYRPGPWRGCSIRERRRGTFVGVVRVEVEHADRVLHGIKADTSFPAIVW